MKQMKQITKERIVKALEGSDRGKREAIALKNCWAKIWTDEDEHHLVLGSGKDLDGDYKSVWFCSCLKRGEP